MAGATEGVLKSSCCESEETKLVDLETLDLRGKNGYPICKSCHDDGHSVVTYGTAKKTGGQAQPKKASKRRAAKGGDDAEEDDDAEIAAKHGGADEIRTYMDVYGCDMREGDPSTREDV